MKQQEQKNLSKRHIKRVVVVCVVLVPVIITSVILYMTHINNLRSEMESNLEHAVTLVEQEELSEAKMYAGDALALAQRLRDDEAIKEVEAHIDLISTIIYGDELFKVGNYQTALEEYMLASGMIVNLHSINHNILEQRIITTERYILFHNIYESAQSYVSSLDYEEALLLFEQAKQIANTLQFENGITETETRIEEMQQLIISKKRAEAEQFFIQGEQFYNNEQYPQALIYLRYALQIFQEIDDNDNIDLTQAKISTTEQKFKEMMTREPSSSEDPQEDTQDDIQDDPDEQSEALSNYEHNSSIDFDLRTLINNQNQRPANQIRMGTTEGMNEGWYNGCGWVATYNALILLGNPKHPAEIVRYFEESGGTVMGGMFGTYPNTIVEYLKSLGNSVDHTLFPQLTLNIDDAIKASRVSILAYAHMNAAHYITIEFNEDTDKFLVYNDRLARERSASLGLANSTDGGAVIDSVAALINNTREILFSFSLIVVQ